MAGAIAMIIWLLVLPVAVLMTGAVASAVIGHFLWKDADTRHDGSELIDTNI